MAQRSAGINVGFGFVKVATEHNEFRYASVVRELPQSDPLGASPTPAQKVKCAGSTYEIGEDAALYGGGTQLKALHRDWANTLAYQVLAQSVVDRLAEEGDNWSVVVGLALDHYKDLAYRRRVQQFWQRDWVTAHGEVKLARVTVVPEPIGAVTMLTADPAFSERINSDLVLVVDFGRLTTNWLHLRRGTPIPDHSGSVDCSMTAALAKATAKIAASLSRPLLDPVDVEMAWLGKAQILSRDQSRSPINVDEAIRHGARRVWPSIEQAIKNSVDARGLDVIVVGGAAIVFKDLLQESLAQSRVIVPDTDPQMINCRGFLRQAMARRAERARPSSGFATAASPAQ